MKTRSQTKNNISIIQPYYGEFELEFDFDDASKQWNANKKKIENACYIYVCGYVNEKTGKKCMKKSKCGECCYIHRKTKK
jgi:hypothetical protein